MQVIFERVDDRRYRIGVVRDGRYDVGVDVPVRGAPGHADVPHDLVHFVVEEQAKLRLGIYGQVAAGGDCGGSSPRPRAIATLRRTRNVPRELVAPAVRMSPSLNGSRRWPSRAT